MKLDLTPRQWWLVDGTFYAMCALAAVFIDPVLILPAIGFMVVDRGIAYFLYGGLFKQPSSDKSEVVVDV